MKKGLLLILPLFIVSLSACSFGTRAEKIIDDNGEIITKRKLRFNADRNSIFDVSNGNIDTYYFDNNIPYVSIDDYINGISYYDAEVIVSDDYDYSFVKDNKLKHIKLDYDKNQMIIYDFDIFNVDEKQYLLDENYNTYLSMTLNETDEDGRAIINLTEYNIRLRKIDEKVVIPFHILDTFFSINSYYYVFYTGDEYYGFSLCDNYITSTKLQKKNKIVFDEEYAEYNFNVMKLVFNEFYGLKYADKDNVIELLESKKEAFMDKKTYLPATKEFISNLEDCHSKYYGLSDLITTDYAGYKSEREKNMASILNT